MERFNLQNLPAGLAVENFCFQTDDDQLRFTRALSKLFKTTSDESAAPRISRLGITGPMGGGKSTLALGLVNAFGTCTRNGELDYKNRGEWDSPNHGTIRIYDNFTEDYHRFNLAQEDPEQDASVVIVEHADIDRKPFDGVVMIMPGDGHPCIKDVLVAVPQDIAQDEVYADFIEEVEDLILQPGL